MEQKKQDPLDEIFIEKITIKELKELREENELLKEGISNEIDNLREELQKIKKKNKFLESQAVDYQRVFEDDRKIYKDQSRKIAELNEKLKKDSLKV